MKTVGTDYKFLVVGPFCWGKGNTEAQAKKVAKKENRKSFNTFIVYLVPPDARVNEMGDIVWANEEQEIILVRKVKAGKDVELV